MGKKKVLSTFVEGRESQRRVEEEEEGGSLSWKDEKKTEGGK